MHWGGLRSDHRQGVMRAVACGWPYNSSSSNIKPAILSERASGGTYLQGGQCLHSDHQRLTMSANGYPRLLPGAKLGAADLHSESRGKLETARSDGFDIDLRGRW